MSDGGHRLALAIRTILVSWRAASAGTPEAGEAVRQRAEQLLESLAIRIAGEEDLELLRLLEQAQREIEGNESMQRGSRG